MCHVVEGENSLEKIKEAFAADSELTKAADELSTLPATKKAIKVSDSL